MTSNEEIKNVLLAQEDASPVWRVRAVELLEALEGAGISVSEASLDRMVAARDRDPKLARYLETLPGTSAGNTAAAENHIGFLSMQISRILRSHAGILS